MKVPPTARQVAMGIAALEHDSARVVSSGERDLSCASGVTCIDRSLALSGGGWCFADPRDKRILSPRGYDIFVLRAAAPNHQTMTTSYFQERSTPAPQNGASPASPAPGIASRGANALSSRITSVLSASYADLEIRDALETLDARQVRNTAETRRQLRLDVQKEVIECNGEIVKDFGEVAEVCTTRFT